MLSLKRLSLNIGKIGTPDLEKDSIRDIAEFFMHLNAAKDSLAKLLKASGAEQYLIDHEVKELFPAEEKKVEWTDGKQKSVWKNRPFFNYMKKNERIGDFLKCVTVNETEVKKLKDGEMLIAAYKKLDIDRVTKKVNKGKETVKVAKMTKKELQGE